MNDKHYQNRTVIITGASAGVGAACAQRFARAGANLVLVARGDKALTDFADSLRPSTKVLTVAMDVSCEEDCKSLVEKSLQEFGAIHLLINNAGLHHRGNVVTQTATNLAQMVDVNLRAPIYLTSLALPHIEAAGGGAVVMIGSLAGRSPMRGAATYAATKAGLKAFTHSLADEMAGTGIKVALVAPGPIDTAFIMDSIDEVEDIVYSQPMSTTAQVADAVFDAAEGEEIEICLPAMSGRLSHLAYLFPRLRRTLRPRLEKIGARNKDKYRNRSTQPESN